MRRTALPIALIAIVACDPGFLEHFTVEESSAISPLAQVLGDFEREHLRPDFHRIDAPEDVAADYRSRGYHVLRWYDRDAVASSGRGSFAYLVVLVDTESSSIELASVAFPSWREPPELQRVRRRLSRDLCAHGFVVEGECGSTTAEPRQRTMRPSQ